MNRFRTRRKAKDKLPDEPHSDHTLPLGLSFSSKGLGKGKRSAPEHQPAVDISAALPASDDFRTSLMLPNLSARFSMLREQDDPCTKIGKANDDSVLFPKRASRLNLFAHHGLTEITEVDSLYDVSKPPFASNDRAHSLDVDGYESDGGVKIKGRPRPGEGNNLFGGRQKLYKIPGQALSRAQADPNISQPSSCAVTGKPIYEDDVSLSLFQKYRKQEREGHESQPGRESPNDTEGDSLRSPSTSFSRYRETASSTMSGPRCNSTAATSIDSQPFSPQQPQHPPFPGNTGGSASGLTSPKSPAASKSGLDRNATMYRKLYGQAMSPSATLQFGAKAVMDMFGRPSAATTAKKEIVNSSQPGNLTPRESPSRLRSFPTSLSSRSASPPPSASSSAHAKVEAREGDAKPLEVGKSDMYSIARPLSPPVSDGEDAAMFARSVQPEDRGKATAMGLFNKPSGDYDEQNFSRRQLQMHQGRDSPCPTLSSVSRSSVPSSHQESPSPHAGNKTSREYPKNDSHTLVRAESLIRDEIEEPGIRDATAMATGKHPETTTEQEQAKLNSSLRNNTQQPPSSEPEAPLMTSSNQSAQETHPAFRPTVEDFRFPPVADDHGKAQSIGGTRPGSSPSGLPVPNRSDGDYLEPSLAGLGLSGLVRTHLRIDSDKSSVCPTASPHDSVQLIKENSNTRGSPVHQPSFDAPLHANALEARYKMAQTTGQISATAKLIKDPSQDTTSRSLEETATKIVQDPEHFQVPQDEGQSSHQRGGSTETQHEREALNKELAERRRKVQENLKSVVELSSRSTSPTPSMESGNPRPSLGFSAILRGKSSRPRPGGQPPVPLIPADSPDKPAKARKVLGLSGGVPPHVSPPKRPEEELWKEEEEEMLEAFARKPRLKHMAGPSPTKAAPRPRPSPPSSKEGQGESGERPSQRSVTPALRSSSARDRSISDVSGRSKSRNGQYRDDLEKAMVEGTGSHARMHALPNASNVSVTECPPTTAKEQPERCASAMSGRYQRDSTAHSPAFYDSKPPHPLQSSGLLPSSSSRPSPETTTYPSFHSAPLSGLSSANASVPASPNIPPNNTDGRSTPSFRSRKRSITKNMISDPTFISTTYTVSTVDLPLGASRRNSKDTAAPPTIPVMNPRRRGRIGSENTTTQTMHPNMISRGAEGNADFEGPPHWAGPSAALTRQIPHDGDGDGIKPAPLKPRQRLRKISSEGGDLNSKARYQALMTAPSPVLPTFPVVKRAPSPTMQQAAGGMF